MTNPHRVDVLLLDKCRKEALLNAILADDQMLVPDPEALRDELVQLRTSRFPDSDVH